MGHPQPEAFVRKLKDNNPTLRLVGEYKNARTPITVRCIKCSYQWVNTTPYHLASGYTGCPSCNGRIPVTRERVQQRLDACTNSTCKIEEDFTTWRAKVRVSCTVCNTTTTALIGSLLKRREKGMGCQHCSRKLQERAMTNRGLHRFKNVVIKGKSLQLMGYEPQAINWILKNRLARLSDIVTGVSNVPRLLYTLGRRQHYHYPDMWIPSQNRLVEVKSRYTFVGTQRNFKMAQAKCRAAQNAGYVYTLLLMNADGRRKRLPDNWWSMRYNEIQRLI